MQKVFFKDTQDLFNYLNRTYESICVLLFLPLHRLPRDLIVPKVIKHYNIYNIYILFLVHKALPWAYRFGKK